MTRSTVLAAVILLIAGLSLPADAADPPPPPPDATAIHVSAGSETTGIDVTLPRLSLGSVTGRVVASGSGKPIEYLGVAAFFPPHRLIGHGKSGADGRYRLKVPASATGYLVCFRGLRRTQLAAGSRPPTGWAPECAGNRPWSGDDGSVPADATRVRVVAGQTTAHIDAALQPGGALSGKVLRHGNGTPLNNAYVYVRSVGDPHYRRQLTTGPDGGYRVHALPVAPRGYQVCVDTRTARVPHADHPQAPDVPRCYRNTVWTSMPDISGNWVHWNTVHWPRTAQQITARPGSPRRGIDVTVWPAGAVAGRLIDRATGQPTDGGATGSVVAFDDSGRLVGRAPATDGRFRSTYLPTGAYHLCLDPRQYFPRDGIGFQRTCYRDVLWTDRTDVTRGPTVHVERGATHRGVVLRVRRASSIHGRLTRTTDGQSIRGVASLFTRNGRFLREAHTGFRHGHYAFSSVPASRSGYLICGSALSTQHRLKPSLQPRCYATGRWDGARRTPPQGATPLAIGSDDHPRVDIALPPGGSISGQVTVRHQRYARYSVFDNRGNYIKLAFPTTVNGEWSVSGLNPFHTYQVCFQDAALTQRFASVCYQDARWYRPFATPE